MVSMDEAQPVSPFRPLGIRLKALRDRANETLAEASGAVEIDVQQLASFELGKSRPTEDILLLLISHFGALDDEAVRLWELAGYAAKKPVQAESGGSTSTYSVETPRSENRILFTDIVDVTVNNYGVVMSFMQGAGPNAKQTAVARVGMSREHAKSVLRILQLTLQQTEHQGRHMPKRLDAPDSSKPDDKTKK